MGWKGVDPAQWARDVQKLNRDVFRESVQELGAVMSNGQKGASGPGIVPVLSGNLANSVQVQKGSMPKIDAEGQGHVTADLAAAQLLEVGDKAFIGYQARYAARQNFGFVGKDSLGRNYNSPGKHFVEAAAARWLSIVAGVVVAVRARSGK